MKEHASSGGFYFLGMIGAAVYFVQLAEGFWAGVLGILQAFVWPALMIYRLFGYLAN